MDLRYWVQKFYRDASNWNDAIGLLDGADTTPHLAGRGRVSRGFFWSMGFDVLDCFGVIPVQLLYVCTNCESYIYIIIYI